MNSTIRYLLVFFFLSNAFAMDGYHQESVTKQKASTLFDEKTEELEEDITIKKGWYDARLITPDTHLYVKCLEGFKLHMQEDEPHELHLYKKVPTQAEPQSHGLVKTNDHSVAISVDTSILTQTDRSSEKKKTHVQYDHHYIKQKDEDFSVDPCELDANNVVALKGKLKSPRTNYDGGHLVDHKFSAQGSHVDNANYVPQHHYYNRWLKEFIVKSADGYLEIPLYTSNPPKIKVKDSNRYDSIPVGILLVPLKKFTILDMYYFPNNQFNYRKYQANLGIAKKGMAQNMISKFRIRKEFHRLLLPAIIYDVKTTDAHLAQQLAHEAKGTGIVGELIEGMSILNLDDEEEALSTLASNVIHQGNVNISNILGLSPENITDMNRGQKNQTALFQAFNSLGQFLVNYAMRNALKSELLSIHSRIMFLNIITDFIDERDEISEDTLDMVDSTYEIIYPQTLQELWKIREHMNLRDLMYFAHLYKTLSSPFIHPATLDGFKIWRTMDFDDNVLNFIHVMEILHEKAKGNKLNTSQMQNLVSLFSDAQNSLAYIVCNGFPQEELAKQRTILLSTKETVKGWAKSSQASSGNFETSPNSSSSFRGLNGINLNYLGTFSSVTYNNEDDNISQDEDDDDDDEG